MMKDDNAPLVEESSWPYASLFFLGFFGTKSPAGRRLARWTMLGLLLFVAAGLLGMGLLDDLIPRWVWAPALPASVLVMVWAYVRYLGELDELGRRIQLEAMALSYGVVLTLVVGWFALMVAMGPEQRLDPVWFLAWCMAAEPLRGVALVHIARKYR